MHKLQGLRVMSQPFTASGCIALMTSQYPATWDLCLSRCSGFEIDHVPNPIEVHHPIRPPQLTVSKVNGALREHFCGVRFKNLRVSGPLRMESIKTETEAR